MTLTSPLTDLKGVGEAVAKKFAVLGITSVGQLIDYFPRRYEDYSRLLTTAQVEPGPVTVQATITSVTGRYVRRGMHITEAVATDASGSIRLLWFNQPYRATALKSNQAYYISGNYELSHQRFAIQNPSLELVSDFTVNTARIIPVYKETKGLTSRQIRAAVAQTLPVLQKLPETLPLWLVAEQQVVSYAQAVAAIHFPESSAQLEQAQRRLGFEEVFQLTLAALLNKQANDHEVSVAVPFVADLAKQFVSHLPFTLTDAQRQVIWQIYQDMQRTEPMNRLVEGDVGSGKTVVAAMAALMALAEDWQVALMAPTELLARQHADTLHKLLQPLGYADRVSLLVGSMTTKQKVAARAAIAAGAAQFLIGTQALIQDSVDVHRLALVVIDEQHRFGVDQRKALQAKAGHMPHVLSLTATPIPRSLALTLYGELDVSILGVKPAGRKPIITKIVSPNSRADLYQTIDQELASGRQLFVVCPLITDSETLNLNSAEKVYQQMSHTDFKHRRVGLLHGKMKPADKTAVMAQFVAHELDILVATTVIEVGVDVPNASIMLIEGAERFGLAQAHQLRGRVGRGQDQGYCYLMLSDSKPPGRRLRALESSNDGFRLAELDLELRGPGAIYGRAQHGQLDLRIAKLTDVKLIASARQAAQKFIDNGEDLLHYKQLAHTVHKLRAVTNLN
ncbi:MAG: ATP-dependent DNA helicase RecG [Patescibacteria group bacterium]|nr:ATP-dependent DNA helicase RecG [Patescibacteria group bacterium]